MSNITNFNKNTNIEAVKKREEKVLAIKENLELSHEGILNYGQEVSQKLTNFSSELLKTMKTKDNPEVEELITQLITGLSSVNADTLLTKKPTFFSKLLKIDNVKSFITKYEDVSSVIAQATDKLNAVQYQLKKDVNLCNKYLDTNIEYIQELDIYIEAGNLKVDEEKEKIKALRDTADMADSFEAQRLSVKEDEVNRLERKLHDLLLMREIAVQNIPQIRLIRSGDAVLVEKIQSSINSAIPLWESQMLVAIQLARQEGALKVQQSVTDATNKLIAQNSELLKNSSIQIAKELEKGIVDIEVLKKSSENLIQTLEGIKVVRKEGKMQREKTTQELIALQMKLNQTALLENKDK